MNFKFFDFPLYADNSDQAQKYFNHPEASFHVFLDESEWNETNKELLLKILAAMKLDIEKDVEIYGLKENVDVMIAQDLDFKSNHRFLGFGMNANRVGLQIKTIPYEIMHIRNLKVLFSHKLSDLQNNVNYKKQLWGLLQNFNFETHEK